MTTETEISHHLPFANANWNTVRAALGLLALAQLLLLSIYLEYAPGYFFTSFALGSAAFYLLMTLARSRKPVAAVVMRSAENSDHIGDIFDDLPVPMIDTDENGEIRQVNSAACALIGRDDLVGETLDSIVEGLGRSIRDRMADTMKGFGLGRPEMARCRRDGTDVYIQVTMSKMKRGDKTTVLAVLSDATELKTLEAQFVQSQKMQAVGQLAGGIAHDFNNILTAIMGHADLLLHRTDILSPDYEDLNQIKQNSDRAAALVGQLLAFSRKQTLRPKSLHLDDTLCELSHLLNRLLGEKVALHTEHGANLKPVRVDERQFEQVIMNLVVNARDAMPDGGTVVIRTRNETLRKELRRDRAVVHPGDYVVVEVRDTGVGISKDKITKIFEPFFTTKKVGEGTGLGLATVYGIIKQTGGFVFADSTEGAGSQFLIYLPVNDEPEDVAEPAPSVEVIESDQTGRGRVLLVEDEAPVRAFAARALALRGYTVTQACSGEEALDVLEGGDEFDVFVSDVVMPGKNGPTWVREALSTRPDAKVVFVSGYAEDAFQDGDPEIPNAAFLAKPFSLVELTQKVKEQIGA
jgi:two-component system cell cycle sensor histidine kinase/response regulator CckA